MLVTHAVRSDGFAGVERHIAVLAQAQRAAGLDVRVVGGSPALMSGVLGDIPHYPGGSTGAVARAVNQLSSDVVHAHMTAAEAAATLAFPWGRTPVVSTRHFASRRGASLAGAALAPLISLKMSRQVAISHYVAGRIDGGSTVIYPGVPRRAAVPARLRDRLVLVAQRLEREKRTEKAIAAFVASGAARAGWHLVIAGDGAERKALERLVEDLDLRSAVTFVGHRSDILALMRDAQVLLAPCPVEGLGMTVLEAMSVGMSVVAAAAGGHLETVGAASREFLFTPNDHDDAAARLARLVGSPPIRADYGAELRDTQRRVFVPELQAAMTLDIYRGVLR